MVQLLSGVPTRPILPNVFHLTLVHNTGVAFGLMRNSGLLVTIGTIGVILFFCWFLARGAALQGKLFGFSSSLILGGAIGNLIDRLRVGAVIDFLDFRIWPVFNLADSCITVGAVLMAWQILKSK